MVAAPALAAAAAGVGVGVGAGVGLGSGAGSGPLDIIAFAVIFVVILLMAYGASKLVGKRALARMKSDHMEVVDSLVLGQDARLFIIKAAGEYFLVSKNAKVVSMLARLENEPGLAGSWASGAAGLAGSAEGAAGATGAGLAAGAGGVGGAGKSRVQGGVLLNVGAFQERLRELLARQLSAATRRGEDGSE